MSENMISGVTKRFVKAKDDSRSKNDVYRSRKMIPREKNKILGVNRRFQLLFRQKFASVLLGLGPPYRFHLWTKVHVF